MNSMLSGGAHPTKCRHLLVQGTGLGSPGLGHDSGMGKLQFSCKDEY